MTNKNKLNLIINHQQLTIKKADGFTLIELLIVISIIGLLAGLSLFALRGTRESARDARRKSDLEAIRSALEIYKADCNRYPGSIAFGGNLVGDGTNCPATNVYIESVPDDILSGRNYSYTPSGAPPATYTLCAALEDETTAVSGCGSCGETCSYAVKNP